MNEYNNRLHSDAQQKMKLQQRIKEKLLKRFVEVVVRKLQTLVNFSYITYDIQFMLYRYLLMSETNCPN